MSDLVGITQTGNTAHQAFDRDGNLISNHARQDQAIRAVINAGGGEVVTGQTLRITVTVPDVTPEPDPDPVLQYPGQPDTGTVLWGSSITGNGDPYERHEQYAGVPLAVRRSFFQWRHIDTGYLLRLAARDMNAGRLPWVSLNTPSWSDMAEGVHDEDIDRMLTQLDGIGGPVWLTIWHEPEGGGGVNEPNDPSGPAGHVAMNRQVRARMDAVGTVNIALCPVLMAYSWQAESGRNPDEWWEPGVYDFLGVDTYRHDESSLVTSRWFDVRAWAESRGVDVAVGEWGMRGVDVAAGERVREWFDHAVGSAADGGGARVVGLAAYDSDGGPTGGWTLDGEQLRVFRELLSDPRTARIIGDV